MSTRPLSPSNALNHRVEAVRRFNRVYTKRLGQLNKGYLRTALTLTEVRVLFELAQGELLTAAELSKGLGLDEGNLSRILRKLGQRRMVVRKAVGSDKRQRHLLLTVKGRKVFASLNRKANAQISSFLAALPEAEQDQFVQASTTLERLLGPRSEPKAPYVLRPHRPGDIGWVIHRHGAIYSREYGWDERYEALVANIAAKFIQEFDPRRERCWIAERDGAIVGSVFLVRETTKIARLRLLLVEPAARGLGIGSRLVDECVRFARQVEYKKITLWTQDILHAAHHIYKKAGFHLVREERHSVYGYDLLGQTWDLDL